MTRDLPHKLINRLDSPLQEAILIHLITIAARTKRHQLNQVHFSQDHFSRDHFNQDQARINKVSINRDQILFRHRPLRTIPLRTNKDLPQGKDRLEDLLQEPDPCQGLLQVGSHLNRSAVNSTTSTYVFLPCPRR